MHPNKTPPWGGFYQHNVSLDSVPLVMLGAMIGSDWMIHTLFQRF